ncbi:AraC family transcriptional regulator [Aeromicrobium sp. Root495]|uniref:DNA-3-methyladenine glycosylase 2 n=1 Tax=Aeromicrobium sp. Root495 TaxID=1736550 RepID=UPI0006F6F787|nr:DNA-3-methyladenine glycosylase 2 [Aeromicrobium sp. Root495]KQY58830.1 AraC family transcriptional regulator [Aeromicrobium sp. Root495]
MGTDLHDQRYRAVEARDPRFDGVFYTAVRTTGIYCRPSCPARTPRTENVQFYASAAAAQDAGFRACRRCRPDTTPGSPEWDVRADVVGRAMRLIRDGVIERQGVDGLAEHLGYSSRHVGRMLTDELGAGPLAIARSARAQTARILIETTSLPLADVAFAAGFASVRQFNDSVRQAYDLTPSELRRRGAGAQQAVAAGPLSIRLAVRQPFASEPLLQFLADHVVPGIEAVDGRTFARTLRLPHGHGVMALTLLDSHVECRLELDDLRDVATAVGRARRLLDLDADPMAVDDVLAADPLLAGSVLREPGLRVPGSVDPFETAVRTVVGQQVSVAGAQTVTGRLVAAVGERVSGALAEQHGLTHVFPSPEAVAAADDEAFSMPKARARAVRGIAGAVADGSLDLSAGADRAETRAQLLALPGIGPWTADYVLMRGLGDPDVLLSTDLVLRRVLEAHGVDARRSASWAPWRSYAGLHLWRTVTNPEPAPERTTP